MRTATALALATLLAPAHTFAQAPGPGPSVREFRIDAGHSDVGFSIGFLGHPVRGRFSDIRGTIAYVAGDPAASAVTVVIGVKSLATGSAHRDEHLLSPDFFDAAKYPSIVFRSSRIAANGSGFVATGALTMHGITRDVAIPFGRPQPLIEDPHGSTLLVASGALRVARKDFGILGGSRYNDWFDAIRSATMADSVDITLEVTGWDTDFGRITTHDAALTRFAREGVAPTIARIRALAAQHPDTLRDAEWELDQVARAVLHRGRTEDAIALFSLSVDVFPRSAAAHAALARAYEVAGNARDAEASVSRALAIDSLNPRALEIRRRVSLPPPRR